MATLPTGYPLTFLAQRAHLFSKEEKPKHSVRAQKRQDAYRCAARFSHGKKKKLRTIF
jgi:hypothetical protein